MKHSLAIMESQHDFLYPQSILLPHNLPRRCTGNTVSTSIIKAVQKRTKSVLQVIFHEKFVLWHRWKKRQWKKGARRCCRQRKQTVCARQRDEMGKDMFTQKRMRRQWRREKVRMEWLEGGSIHDRRVILTVGHTLILDLQVLVRPWAGVREDIWTRDHNALGPIVASVKNKQKQILQH